MQEKKVGIDARMIEMSGIGTYIQHLIDSDIYEIALGDKKLIGKYNSQLKMINYAAPIYGIKEQFTFPYREVKKSKIDLMHFPHYNIPLFYRGKFIVTIHDLTHLILPEFLPNKFAYYYAKFMIGHAAKKAEHVFTVSENTKKDIVKMFKVNPEKITVTYNGVDKDFRIKKKEEIEYLYEKFQIPKNKKIIMYVGNLKPHKNLERLLEAFALLKNRNDKILLLVGKAFKSVDLQKREEELKIEGNVIHTGLVTKDELVDFYNLADLFVFPSLYEGFGIPPLEAMACGTPVICADNSSLPEVVGNVAIMFDALNILDLCDCMNQFFYGKYDVVKLINQGLDRIRLFDWNESIEKVKQWKGKV
jgi:Glycosyltransferase